MLFPRIQVREGLLTNSYNRGARYAEQIEIDMSTSRSARALELLQRGQAASRIYMVDQARLRFCEAGEAARQDCDGFVEAAAGVLQTILMDGMSPCTSQGHFLSQAAEVLDYELFTLRERLTEERTPREVALPIMTPRLALMDLIKENQAEYQFRQDSLLLADTRVNVDRHLAAANWFAAESVARIGSENATATFGPDHWWNAVMLVRQATALLRQSKVKLAQPLIQRAAFIFQEWTDYQDRNCAFKREFDILATAQSDVALMTN